MGVSVPHQVLVPPLGQTTDTVTLVTWYKDEGEEVEEGEPLFAIETDKATLDIEAQASGTLRGVSVPEGQEVKVLSTVALIVGAREQAAVEEAQVPSVSGSEGRPSPVVRRTVPALEQLFVSPRARRLAEAEEVRWEELSGTGPEGAVVERDVRAYVKRQARRTITPLAERIAEEAGLDWRQLEGSAPNGRVIRQDVEAAIEARARAAPTLQRPGVSPEKVTPRPYNEPLAESPLKGVRAIIAERMAQSTSETARVTLTADVDASALVALREQLSRDGYSVSYNAFFLYVLGRALREYPALNASVQGDMLRQWKRIHVGLAVDTDRSLLVPVLRDVDQKRLQDLSQETEDVIARARTNKLRPDELTGGTFTLTNLGMYGIDAFTPIINLPETAILGVGRIKARPVAGEGGVCVRPVAWLSLTFDHRVVDGAPAARFMQRVAQLVERPHLMHM
jgi:pyruvate dehydrogenase E2 component (dihydrolipoamide acetyltransferase)